MISKSFLYCLSSFSLAICSFSCSNVPVSERKQLNLISDKEMLRMSLTSYNDYLKQSPPLPANSSEAKLVDKVASRIARSVEEYMKSHGYAEQLKNFQWEFNTVNDKAVNAWCMPGGKVVVYTGLLAVTKNEAGLAVVLGHEIAHAIARHGNERMSQQLLTELGGTALSVVLSDNNQATRDIFMGVYGAGAQVGILLPYSRVHETEADKLGLVFMAMAGYDPREAPLFWQRMTEATKGKKVPELLSTHPSNDTRIKDLNAYMPEALKFYKEK